MVSLQRLGAPSKAMPAHLLVGETAASTPHLKEKKRKEKEKEKVFPCSFHFQTASTLQAHFPDSTNPEGTVPGACRVMSQFVSRNQNNGRDQYMISACRRQT